MKTRVDFVSNSSSSSFVVLADENTPSIFRENFLNFKQYYAQFFSRDVIDSFRYGLVYSNRDPELVLQKIRFVSDREFVDEYVNDGVCYEFSKKYVVLESDREIVDKLRETAEENYRMLGQAPRVYKRGNEDCDLARAVRYAINRVQQKCENRVDGLICKIASNMGKALGDVMSDWKFWYAELDDTREHEGEMELKSVKWARIFNNH